MDQQALHSKLLSQEATSKVDLNTEPLAQRQRKQVSVKTIVPVNHMLGQLSERKVQLLRN